MAKRPTLADITTGHGTTTKLNENFTAIEVAFDNTLSRDGSSPNQMEADLDMNSKKIINLQDATTDSEPLTYGQYIAGGASAVVNGFRKETQTATSGQTEFTANIVQWVPGIDNLIVFVNGEMQGTGLYTVDTSTQITFSSGLTGGDRVDFVVMNIAANSVGSTIAAGLVSYNAANTTNVRNVELKLREFVSVKDFGAVGDGVTDDTTAIQTAFNSGAKVLLINSGEYKITSQLNISNNINVICEPGVILNGTFIPASTVIGEQVVVRAAGTTETAVLLTSNITEESSTVVLSSTATFAAKDYIFLSSTAKFSAGWPGNNYQGWITSVESIDSGTNMTVSTNAFAALNTADTAKAEKINPITIRWYGGKILGGGLNKGHSGLVVRYGVDCTVENLEVDGCENVGVAFSRCFNSHAKKLSIKNCISTPALGNSGWGMLLGNGTMYSSCSNSYFERCRHSISGEGTYPTRFVDILHNHSVDAGIGTRNFTCEDYCYYWKFDANATIGGVGGFFIRGSFINVTNNFIRNSSLEAISVFSLGVLTDGMNNFVIDGNVIDQAQIGIRILKNTNVVPKNVVISNNTMDNCELEGILCTYAENVTIVGNTINDVTDGTGLDGNGIRVSNNSRIIISDNVIGNTIDNGILSESNTGLILSNNVFHSITGNNWTDTGPSTFADTDNVSSGRTYSKQLNLIDGVTAPSTESGYAVLYVDSADGDLKVKFGDGTVKTIVTDS